MMRIIICVLTMILISLPLAFAEDSYFCPMHPHYTSDQPGDCPICHMKLVKRDTNAPADLAAGPEERKAMGIETATVRSKHMMMTIDVPGTIMTKYPLSYRNYQRTATQVRNWGTIRVSARVYEQDLLFVRNGQEAEISIPSLNVKHPGKVRLVDRVIDPVTRTALVTIDVFNFTGEWAENMAVQVRIKAPQGELLLVPVEAVLDTGTQKIVFVQTASRGFQPRVVQTGARGDHDWQIISGLMEGETVGVSGNFLLDSESRIRQAQGGGQ